MRQETPWLTIVLGPLIYLLRITKVAINFLTTGVTNFTGHSIPDTIINTRNHLASATPNSVYCFNKTGFLIFLADLYFVWFYLYVIVRRSDWVYLYLAFKIASIIMPYIWFTPVERLPFWIIGVALTVVETFIGLYMIVSWGYGIVWEEEHFYHHWKKHYRYMYATGNRQLTVELSAYIYVISKLLILNDYFCYNPKVRDARLDAPHSNTKGVLDVDLNYVNLLVEQDSVANLRYGILFLLALSSLGVYSIILAGWSSNSKYAFIGALRSAAQMISYEVAISLIILPVVLFAGSLNLTMITHVQNITVWFLWPLLPISILFLIAMLAETNRTPFDLPEAEAELVAGYNVDYSSLPFAMFFLGEYCNMILISTVYCLLFLGGGLNDIGIPSALVLASKAAVTWVFFVLVRATLPRYRYDQLMDIGWKVFLPVSGSFLLLVFGILVYFDALPVANELPLDAGSQVSNHLQVALVGHNVTSS
jgi:formate hydrogenlyase subunit 4